MSAKKKSFDLEPSRRKAAKSEPKQEKKRSPHPRLSQRAPKRPLRDRRRDEAMRSLSLFAALTVIVAGALLFLLWRPEVRISTIVTEGGIRAEGVEELALAELRGTYYFVIPRDSFFFYPEHAVRDAVLARYPEVAALSVGRSGFTSLTLEAVPRIASFHWCGAPETLGTDGSCYETDVEGFVFARAAVSAEESGMLRVYASLNQEGAEDSYPLRSRVEGAPALPSVLQFVSSINALGIPVASIALRGDEVDLFVAPGTRLTYVIGKEQEALQNAKAAFPTLTLTDGSVEYVDLRFDGKVYLRRRE